MTTALLILSLFIAMWTAAFCGWKLQLWSALLIGILILFSLIPSTSLIVLLFSWAIVLPVIVILNIPTLRSRYLSHWMLKKFNEKIPKLSATETAALKAGDVWWEKQLFCGQPNWNELFALPKCKLSKDEEHFMNTKVVELCEMLNDWEINQSQNLPDEAWAFIKKEKFLGMIIDKEYGGLGFSPYAHSTVIMTLASRSYCTAVNVMVPNSLGPAEFLLHYGSEEQKQKYLPKLATGDEIPCFALTSPTAGSDAAAITDSGIVCEGQFNGKTVIGLRLNWNKRYITLAPIATLLGLAVKVSDPDQCLGSEHDLGITFCLVPTDLPGITIGNRHKPLYVPFINGPTQGKDVFIPLENVIGGPKAIGKGWEMIMSSLSVGRAVSLPAVSSGTAKACFALTSAYCCVREQFQVPLAEFEGIQESLSRIGGYTYMCEATRQFTLSAAEAGVKPTVASAIAKYHLTEMNRKIVNDAMDIHGGRGIMMGKNNYLGNFYIAAPINVTVEGANILTRNLIIFGQGAIRCHPYAADEIEAASDPDKKTGQAKFDHLIFEHLGWAIGNGARSLFYGLSGGKFIPVPKGETTRYLKQLTRMSTALVFVSDLSMMFVGGKLKRKERLSARLGDILSHLYMASSVVKYFHDHAQDESETPFLHWALQTCLFNVQTTLVDFLDNLKPTWLAWWLKRGIFFWGLPYKSPSDQTCKDVARGMCRLSYFRAQILEHYFRSRNKNDAANKMQHAFELVLTTQASYRKLQKAKLENKIDYNLSVDDELETAFQMGVLTHEEVSAIKETKACQMDVIQVDDFQTGSLS